MFRDSEFLSTGGVMVSEKRLSVGKHSVSLEGVQNVEILYYHRTWTPELSLLATTALFAISGLVLNNAVLQMAAVALLMATGIVFWNRGPRYAIALDTQNGRITPLTSSDRTLVESVGQFLQARMQPVHTSHAHSFPHRLAVASRIRHRAAV